MPNKTFSYGEAVRFGWRATKQHFWVLLAVLIVGGVIMYLPAIVLGVASGSMARAAGVYPVPSYQILATNVLSALFQIGVSMGFITVALRIVDGQPVAFSHLFSSLPRFLQFLGATILQGLIVLGGTILLIIPGIIWGLKYQLAPYFVVDKGLGPVDALRASGRATAGAKMDLFIFGLLLGFINLLGALVVIVGLLFTVPLSMIAYAWVYRQLAARAP